METRERWLVETFLEVSDFLAQDRDLSEFLVRVAELSVELLGARIALIVVADDSGKLGLVTTSTYRPELSRLVSTTFPDCPCRTSLRDRAPVLDDRLDGSRWPQFAEGARDLGFVMIHTVPMRHRDQALGVLQVLQDVDRPIDPDDAALLQALADLSGAAILNHRAMERATTLAGQLQFALDSRVVIEQAKGVVAARLEIDVGDAFGHLRAYARTRGARMLDVSRAVLDGTIEPGQLLGPRTGEP